MIEIKYELDMYPMVKNRSVVNLFPTKLYLDWLNYIRDSNIGLGLNDLDPISFLIKDFDDKSDFEYWLQSNYQLLFEIEILIVIVSVSVRPSVSLSASLSVILSVSLRVSISVSTMCTYKYKCKYSKCKYKCAYKCKYKCK